MHIKILVHEETWTKKKLKCHVFSCLYEYCLNAGCFDVLLYLTTWICKFSAPLSLNTIFEEVMNSEVGRTMTLDRVRASLIQLGCPPSITDESYSVGMNLILFSFLLVSRKVGLFLISSSLWGVLFSPFSVQVYWQISISCADLKKMIDLDQNDEVCLIFVPCIL